MKNPSLADGLCHICEERRQKIQLIHMQFPETNPEYEYKDQEENKSWHLDLWRENNPKYPKLETYLKKFDPLFDHKAREDAQLKKKLEETLEDLFSLERHFRLARLYIQRNRNIAKNFRKALGRE